MTTRSRCSRAARRVAVLLIAAAAALAAAEPAPPLEAFARRPDITDVALSPDGKRFAAFANPDERTVLIARALDGGAPTTLLQTDNREFQFNWVRWVNDERLVVSLRFPSRRGFVTTLETRLISIKADGSGMLRLVTNRPEAGSLLRTVRQSQLEDRVLDWMPEDGHHILLQLREPDRTESTVYSVDVDTGERRGVQGAQRNVVDWLTDAQHRVRIAIRQYRDENEVRVRDPEGKDWRTLWTWRDERGAVQPLGFGLDPQELYVRADHDGRAAIFTVRLDDPALPRTLRYAHARLDAGSTLMRSPVDGEVIGLLGSGEDDGNGRARAELWSAEWRGRAMGIDQALPGRANRIVQISRDGRRYLLYSSGDRQPGEYFVGLRDTSELVLLAQTRPTLKPEDLAGKRRATIPARDGLALPAYLTLPRGAAAAQPRLPMVLLPHGGPQGRDDADFDEWVELLASRGYAVLQVNFRGSEGYGSDFREAGLQRWGLEMQDDLTDAVRWAVAQGIADPKRICIAGASYGGYAALMGVVKSPELYRCAVSFAGVTNLPDLVAHLRDYVGGADYAERAIGKSWGDRERLRATSPALQAERIRVPVLLVHGTADRQVPVEQSRDMAAALKSAGKTVRYIEQDGGDHHLTGNPQRLEFFGALEAFLAEQLKP